MMEWLYGIGEWTFSLVDKWWGMAIWGIWMGMNFMFIVINMFYPLANAFAGGKDEDLLWNPILALGCQFILFILILWAGSLLYGKGVV